MDGLILIVIIFVIGSAVGKSSRRRMAAKHQQQVDEQRQRRQSWQSGQAPPTVQPAGDIDIEADQRQHPWENREQTPASTPRTSTPRASTPRASTPRASTAATANKNRQPQPAANAANRSNRQPQTPASARLNPTAPMERIISHHNNSVQERLFQDGLNQQELVMGIVMAEVLGPPLAKRARAHH